MQYAKTAKQVRYLAPAMIIILGVVLGTLGLTYEGIDLALYAGIIIVAIGVAFVVIQHRMVRELKT